MCNGKLVSANCWVYSGWSNNFCSNIWSQHSDKTPLHHQCGLLSISTISKVAHQIDGGMFSSLADYWSLLLTQRGDRHTHTHNIRWIVVFPAEEVSEWVSECVEWVHQFFVRKLLGLKSSTGWVPKFQWFPTQIQHLCRFFFFWGGSGIFEPQNTEILHYFLVLSDPGFVWWIHSRSLQV